MGQLVTEDEARQKWCPFAREVYPEVIGSEARAGFASGSLAGVANIHGSRQPHTRVVSPQGGNTFTPCVASACMLWEWGLPPYDDTVLRKGYCTACGIGA